MLEQFRDYAAKEWRVVRQAPGAFTLTLLFALLIAWACAVLLYGERIAALEERRDFWRDRAEMIAGTGPAGAQPSFLNIERRVAETTLDLRGPQGVAPRLIPPGSSVFGVFVKVTRTITGAQAMSVGVPDGDGYWGNGLPTTKGTVSRIQDFIVPSPVTYHEGTDVVIQAVDGEFTGGTVKIAVVYEAVVEPN